MKQAHYWGILIGLLLFSSNLFSQSRFKVAVVGGFNISQIDGDNFVGYKKFGWNGGLRASTIFTKKVQLDFELLFSQRGSLSGDFEGFSKTPHWIDIQLNYAEIPILFTYKWKKVNSRKSKKAKNAFYKFAFNGGISVGRIIGTTVEERLDENKIDPTFFKRITSWELIEDHIIKSDITGTVGISYFLNKNIGVLMRSSTSLTPLYLPKKNDGYGKLMRNYYLTSMVFYQF